MVKHVLKHVNDLMKSEEPAQLVLNKEISIYDGGCCLECSIKIGVLNGWGKADILATFQLEDSQNALAVSGSVVERARHQMVRNEFETDRVVAHLRYRGRTDPWSALYSRIICSQW